MCREDTEAEASRDLVYMQSLDMKAWLQLKRCKLSREAGASWVMRIYVNVNLTSPDIGKAAT